MKLVAIILIMLGAAFVIRGVTSPDIIHLIAGVAIVVAGMAVWESKTKYN